MTKDKRFEFVLPESELLELRAAAKQKEISAGEFVRRAVQAAVGAGSSGREPESVKERPAKASVETPRPVGSTPTPSAAIRTDSRETAEASLMPLTQRLKNQGYTTPVAERMAREQLGLAQP